MRVCLSLLAALLLCSCTIKTANDYDQYLRNNTGAVMLPKIDADVYYSMTERTKNHHTTIKTWMGGIFNSWTVEFGSILDSTMRSGDVQAAFRSLQPKAESTQSSWVINYDLLNYIFIENRAKVSLSITTTSPDGRSMTKEYFAEGQPQLGKMYWGGVYAIKNAVQQSTKLALDAILMEYFKDLAAFMTQG